MFTRDVTFYPPVTAQLPGANGYTGGKVIFIDTEVPFINITLQTKKFLKCVWLRPVVFKPNLKYLHVKITASHMLL